MRAATSARPTPAGRRTRRSRAGRTRTRRCPRPRAARRRARTARSARPARARGPSTPTAPRSEPASAGRAATCRPSRCDVFDPGCFGHRREPTPSRRRSRTMPGDGLAGGRRSRLHPPLRLPRPADRGGARRPRRPARRHARLAGARPRDRRGAAPAHAATRCRSSSTRHWHWDHSFGNSVFRPARDLGPRARGRAPPPRRAPQAIREVARRDGPSIAAELAEVVIDPPEHTFEERATVQRGRPRRRAQLPRARPHRGRHRRRRARRERAVRRRPRRERRAAELRRQLSRWTGRRRSSGCSRSRRARSCRATARSATARSSRTSSRRSAAWRTLARQVHEGSLSIEAAIAASPFGPQDAERRLRARARPAARGARRELGPSYRRGPQPHAWGRPSPCRERVAGRRVEQVELLERQLEVEDVARLDPVLRAAPPRRCRPRARRR